MPGLMRRTEKLAAIIFVLALFFVSTPSGLAQQTVFNVPSADVMERGKVYSELDVSFTPSASSSGLTPRVVAGIGRRVELGINLNGIGIPGVVQVTPTTSFKWKAVDRTERQVSFIIGDDVSIPAVHRSYSAGNYLYAEIAKTWASKARVTAGAYDFSSHVVANGNRAGGQFAVEQPLGDRVILAADWYTGRHALGYITPGVVLKQSQRLTWYVAYEVGNSAVSQGNHQFLIEIGWNLN